MPRTHEISIAKATLIAKLFYINFDKHLHLNCHQIVTIAQDLIRFFTDIANEINSTAYLINQQNNNIQWTPTLNNIITHFKEIFLRDTTLLGMIGPIGENALWAGTEGHIAARKFGTPVEKSLAVKLVDSAFLELKAAFFPDEENNIQQKAIVVVYWAIVSLIYVENIVSDIVHIYTHNKDVSSNSFFWNYELYALQKLHPSAIKYIHSLKPSALHALNNLKTQGFKADSEQPTSPIYQILINENNWHKQKMEHVLTLRDNDHSLPYNHLVTYATRWSKHTPP